MSEWYYYLCLSLFCTVNIVTIINSIDARKNNDWIYMFNMEVCVITCLQCHLYVNLQPLGVVVAIPFCH